MFHRVMPAGFEDIEEPNNIALNVNIGVINAVPHPGLGSEMNNIIELLLRKELHHAFLVLEVHAG